MKNRKIAVYLSALILSQPIVTLAETMPSIKIENKEVDFKENKPFVKEGRTFVPAVDFFEILGFKVDLGQDGRVVLEKENTKAELEIGSKSFKVDGETYSTDVASELVGEAAMLPLRAILESMGYGISWDKDSHEIIIDLGNNKLVRLQDDFYEAINGDWIKNAEIPSTKMAVGGFTDLADEVDINLQNDFEKMLKGEIKPSKELEEFIKFYNMTLDFEKREEESGKPLIPYIESMENIKSLDDLNENIVKLTRGLAPLPFGFGVMADMKDAKMNNLYISAPGLYLPDKTMYGTEQGDMILNIMEDVYVDYLKLMGKTEEEGRTIVKSAFKFDERLIPYNKTNEENSGNIMAMYNPSNLEELKKMASNMDIGSVLEDYIPTKVDKLVLLNKDYYENFNKVVNEESFEDMKNWMIVGFISSNSNILSEDFRQASLPYLQLTLGQEELDSKEKHAYDIASGLFSEPIGIHYGKKYFGEEAKKDVELMVNKMIEVYKNRLENNDWLGEDTKKMAIKKLDTMAVHIGYPDKVSPEFNEFKIDTEKNIFDNMLAFNNILVEKNLSQYGKEVNKGDWNAPGHMVNAFYSPMDNSITFPAAILQAPFYSKEQSDSANYGGIGAVIAHEISHAFDPNGSRFDEFGNMKNWWTEEDYKAFEEKTEAMVKEFDGIEYAGGEVNGRLTLSENVADAGGLSCALEVAMSLEDSDLEDFFNNWAIIWRMKARPEYEQMLLKVDTHSPNKLRSNIQLMNIDEFMRTFDVKDGDKMYKKPEDRISIW